jgi:thioredoxin reductase (NADPH)
VQDKAQFKDKKLIIVGGGDSALDWAMNLEPIAESITLVHRRDVFRAHEESVDWLLNRSTVKTRLFWEIKGVHGNGMLERVTLVNSRTGEEDALDADACLVNIGFNASIGPIRNWGLELQGTQIRVNERMETNVPGVYAAGDVCAHEGKLKLIATGVGEVCIAVNYAKVRIDPTARAFPGHSSNMDL